MKFNLEKAKKCRLIPPKHDVSHYDQVELERGMKIEMEHTTDKDIAMIIAANHLDESPDYYKHLKDDIDRIADSIE